MLYVKERLVLPVQNLDAKTYNFVADNFVVI